MSPSHTLIWSAWNCEGEQIHTASTSGSLITSCARAGRARSAQCARCAEYVRRERSTCGVSAAWAAWEWSARRGRGVGGAAWACVEWS
jgi:hypothetical protein